MRYTLTLICLGAMLLFSACKDELPKQLQGKTYSFDDVKNNICSKKTDGCVSLDANTIAFIDSGYAFVINKDDASIISDDCWTGASGIEKMFPYREVFLALVVNGKRNAADLNVFTADEFAETSKNGDVYLINKDRKYAKIGEDISDVVAVGNDIYAISNRDIMIYKGTAGAALIWDRNDGRSAVEAGVTSYWFNDGSHTVRINTVSFKATNKNPYPTTFEQCADGSVEVNFSDGTSKDIKELAVK